MSVCTTSCNGIRSLAVCSTRSTATPKRNYVRQNDRKKIFVNAVSWHRIAKRCLWLSSLPTVRMSCTVLTHMPHTSLVRSLLVCQSCVNENWQQQRNRLENRKEIAKRKQQHRLTDWQTDWHSAAVRNDVTAYFIVHNNMKNWKRNSVVTNRQQKCKRIPFCSVSN